MVSVASDGTADRIVARILFRVVRAGSGTSARYSSMFVGTALLLAGAFFIGVILQRRFKLIGCHSFNNCFLAASTSLRLSASIFGKESFISSSVWTITSESTRRVNHLLSAGTTYHGAPSVAVLRIMSS